MRSMPRRRISLILGWVNTTCDPAYSVTQLFHSRNCGMSGNRAYLKDDKVDEMIDAAAVENKSRKNASRYKRPSGLLK